LGGRRPGTATCRLHAPATTRACTLSLHDALPIYRSDQPRRDRDSKNARRARERKRASDVDAARHRRRIGEHSLVNEARRRQLSRSEEHTSELQYVATSYAVSRVKKKTTPETRGAT